eukprot:jgi/Bigna1/86963/estExt_fgenesh1_pg.C_150186
MSGTQVDIPCTQLNAWLCNRGLLKKKWQSDLREIQSKIKESRKLLPAELQEKIERDAIGYPEVIKIIDSLEQKEKASGKNVKTMFGGYSSDLLREWDGIRQAYIKNNLYLGEFGRILSQRLKYDIPRMRKLVQDSGRQISELERKMSDREQLSREWRAKFVARCKELKISGVNVRQELKMTVRELPAALEKVCEETRSEKMKAGIALYCDFVKFLRGFSADEKKKAEVDEKHIPTLHGLKEVREALPYDLEAAEKQLASASDEKEVENGWALVNANDAGPPVGGEGGSSSTGGNVGWNMLNGNNEAKTGREKGGGDAKNQEAENREDGINWDFEVAEVGTGEKQSTDDDAAGKISSEWGITVEETDVTSAPSKGISRTGNSILIPKLPKHILEKEELRNQLINDLLELKCFYRQRLSELEDGDSVCAGQYSKRDRDLALAKRCTDISVKGYLKIIESSLSALNKDDLQRMLLIKSGERYVTRLADSITQLDRNAKKMHDSIGQIRSRQQSIRRSVTQTNASLGREIKRCKKIQVDLEDRLKEMFPEVLGFKIVGEIDKL